MSLYSAIGYLSGLSLGVSADHDDFNTENLDQNSFDVTFVKKENPLGIKLALKRRGGENPSSKVVVIDLPRDAETGEMGQVEASGKVIVGDQLIMVNDQVLPDDDFPATVALLKTSSWPLVLKFRRLRRPPLSEAEVEHLLSDNSPATEQRKARMLEALKSSTGGPLLLKTIEFRSSVRSHNQSVIKNSQDLDLPLKKLSDVIMARTKGSQAFVDELNKAPQLKAKIKDISKQVGSISASIERIETLLSERDSRRAASNPFTFVNIRNKSSETSSNDQSHSSPSSTNYQSPSTKSPLTTSTNKQNQNTQQQPNALVSSSSSSPRSPTSTSSSSLDYSISSSSSSSNSSPEFDMSEMSPVDALNLSLRVVDDLLDRRNSRSESMLTELENDRDDHEDDHPSLQNSDDLENDKVSVSTPRRNKSLHSDTSSSQQLLDRVADEDMAATDQDDNGVNDALRALLGDDFKTVTNQKH